MMRSLPLLWAVALGAGLLGAGCDDKKSASDAPRVDGGASTDKYATADPKLENALHAASSASAANANGPPPDGVFADGAADKKHPRGAATSVDIVSEGEAPRVDLRASAADASATDGRAAIYGRAVLEMVMMFGPRNALAVDYGLTLGPAKKDEGGADWLVAEIKKAVPADRQMGQVAPGTDKDLATLEGTTLRVRMTPDGRESDVEVRPGAGKAVRPEIERFASDAAEALVLATVPLPSRPVGVGAQWIAETRMPLSGLDVIAYRAYRVKEIDGDRARLTVNVKAYAASTEVKLQGVPKGATLTQYDAQSQAEIEVVRGEPLARKSDAQGRSIMIFQAPGAAQEKGPPGMPSGNLLTAQLQNQATLVRGDDLRMTAK